MPIRLALNAPLNVVALFGVEVELGAELVAVPSVAAFSEADSAEVALAAEADVADLAVVVFAANVSESAPVSTAAAACARPPKPEYVCR